MTALTANAPNLKTQPNARTRTFQVKNAQTIYHGALVALDSGYLVPWSDTSGLQFLGVFEGFEPIITDDGIIAIVGDTGNAPDIRGIVDVSGAYLNGVDVTGVSAITSLGAQVFGPDDNYATPSLTGTVDVGPIGWLADFRSATDMDVKLYTPNEYMARESSKGSWTFSLPLATLAAATIQPFTPEFAGRIDKMYSVVTTVASTASKLATLRVQIGTTDITGGTLDLTTANCDALGEVNDAAAMTALATFGATDTISVDGSSITAFIEGQIDLVIEYTAY